ncbi:MAG: carboxymethylenebutenolidase [Flavobacteriaceae bacterium]|jgi:carboxymethylenebutenolidase
MTDLNHIDQRIYDLYDEYCHSGMSRRDFLQKAGAIAIAGISGLAMAQSLLPRYAQAQTISFTDDRIKATYVDYESPGGSSGEMRAYLVRPTSEGPHPSVVVIHENRGLNPYIEDVARRFATMGFLSIAPDGLSPVGGYPGNDDDGKILQKSLDQSKLKIDMLNSAKFIKTHDLSTGKLGSVGFCWGGGATNYLATEMGDDLHAAVPFYGAPAEATAIPNISAPLMIQAAENDKRINAMWPDFENALKTAGKGYERHLYEGTGHGFHNNSTPRFNKEAAALAESRTMEFFKTHLA